jgi:hypothetical protein
MADKKISALTAASTPLAGTEVLPIVQSGATVKVAVSDLTVGRAISATQLTLTTGNVIVSSGQGIDFSATPGTGTSELLNDYEEGTWTPTQGAGLTVVGAFSSTGVYTKIGRIVTVSGTLTGATTISAAISQILCGNLPFAPTGNQVGCTSVGNINQFGGIVTIGTNLYAVTAITVDAQILFNITFTI